MSIIMHGAMFVPNKTNDNEYYQIWLEDSSTLVDQEDVVVYIRPVPVDVWRPSIMVHWSRRKLWQELMFHGFHHFLDAHSLEGLPLEAS